MTADKDETDVPALPDPDSAKTRRRLPGKLVLVAAGVGLVGLAAGGGIGFAVGHGGSGAASTSTSADDDLALPSSLPGGLERSDKVDSQIKSSVSSAAKALAAGTDMALYTKGKTQVLVEATRLPGDALLQAGMTYAKVGDAVCATSSATSGSAAICVRSSDGLTVKVTAATSDTATKYADEVFSSVS